MAIKAAHYKENMSEKSSTIQRSPSLKYIYIFIFRGFPQMKNSNIKARQTNDPAVETRTVLMRILCRFEIEL